MRLLLLAIVMLAAQPNTEAPLERALQRVWAPRPGSQSKAFASTAPEVMLSGFKFGGKSNLLDGKAACYGQRFGPNRTDPKNGRPYPPARVLLAREERAAMEETLVYTMRMEILGPELHDAMYQSKADRLVFPNGSVIMYRGLDQPRRIQGMRYGFAGADQAEELSEEQYEMLNAGCTQAGMPWTQTFGAYNPEGPGHWAYLRMDPDAGDGPRYRDGVHFADVVHAIPHEFDEILGAQSIARLGRMTGVMRDRLVLGKWVAFTGLVFEMWDPSVHMVDKPSEWSRWGGYPPPSWRRWRGIDFGFVHPWACAWVAESPIGYRYLYRQDVRTRLSIPQQCERILRAEARELATLRECAKGMEREELGGDYAYLDALHIAGTFSDHEAGHRATYAELGVHTQLARKDGGQIETLRALLDPNQPGGPQFMVVKGSLEEPDQNLIDAKAPISFEQEISRWAYQKGKQGRKDKPEETNEDAIDAVMYCEHTRAVQGAIGVWA